MSTRATFRSLHPLFGAELSGVAIDACMADDIAEIRRALETYGLLVCRDVAIDDVAHRRCAGAY
jgi:alpha-ketoglutarate-dependent taurine dioxygenase